MFRFPLKMVRYHGAGPMEAYPVPIRSRRGPGSLHSGPQTDGGVPPFSKLGEGPAGERFGRKGMEGSWHDTFPFWHETAASWHAAGCIWRGILPMARTVRPVARNAQTMAQS
ncbi:hypothetical protein C6I21_04575 [Alkalicoccus urumqiensis]|uniref:Uncharacterized protein n=1 Tax=Alkalicoccus urumqiensis TaxID=1548213 RepID=A0A2P6MK42_ALKUR|nr:hypothetical protein C6I21_04575 [Alkalicoccus urumqiensis]